LLGTRPAPAAAGGALPAAQGSAQKSSSFVISRPAPRGQCEASKNPPGPPRLFFAARRNWSWQPDAGEAKSDEVCRRERERETVCVCVCARARMLVCLHLSLSLSLPKPYTRNPTLGRKILMSELLFKRPWVGHRHPREDRGQVRVQQLRVRVRRARANQPPDRGVRD
jgi:hypothetical protein